MARARVTAINSMAGAKLWAVGFLRHLADDLEAADRVKLAQALQQLPLQQFHRDAARLFPSLRVRESKRRVQ